MAQRKVTREMQPLSLRADVVPSTLNEEKRTVQLVWTTGARVMRGFFDQYWEELSLDPKHVRMDRLNSGAAPLLNSHNADDLSTVIGVVESASLQKNQGLATVRFARAEDDPVADQIFRKVKDGIIKNVSVGYRVQKLEKIESAEGKIPVYRATDWTPHEVSMVAIGADADATVRSAGAVTNPCEFTFEERAMDPENDTPTPAPTPEPALSPALVATRAAERARQEESAALSEAAKRAAAEAIGKERTRCSEIDKIAVQSRLGEAWARALKDGGTTVEEARKAALDHLASNETPIDATVRIGAGDDESDKYVRGASAWLVERTGKRKLIEQAMKREPELFTGLEFGGGASFRGLSPMEIARDTLERRGVKTRGMDKMRMIGMAFTYRSGAMQTTSDFANIMENVLHKFLLGSYATQETTWQVFCGTEDVPDFRSSTRYRTGSLPSLPKILEHGEYTNGVIPDAAKYTISTERHGEMFSLSREAIINDDMGALANLAMEFGRAAARTIENDVYALLALNSGLGPTMADGQVFFHSSHSNVGTGAAISVASLDADRVLMRAQKDPSGRDYLSLRPRVLLVPDALEGTARVINVAQYDPDTANKLQRPNMVQGLFTDIVGSPRLGPTTTRRYIFADPAIATAFVVAFLEGYGRGPIMESQAGWRVDGVEWKVTQYAKAQAADTKAAVTNAGV